MPPPPVWRRELQQRVEAYRARQAAAGLHSPEVPTPADNLVNFPTRLQQQAAEEEPLADPVVAAPRPREATEGATVRVLPAPPRSRPSPMLRPEAEPEAGLADIVRAVAPRERRLLAASPQCVPSAAFLQIPLPMAAEPTVEAFAVHAADRTLRLGAGLVDLGVVLAGALLFTLAGWASQDFAPLPPHGLRPLLPALAAVPMVLAALYLGLSTLAGGVTVGMRQFGLRVASLEGELTPEALRRRGWASLMSLGALGLGFIWMYCDAQGLTWHDSISGTCITGPEAALE
ncbi:MAG: RDD family protein [Terriglobales bacterium]